MAIARTTYPQSHLVHDPSRSKDTKTVLMHAELDEIRKTMADFNNQIEIVNQLEKTFHDKESELFDSLGRIEGQLEKISCDIPTILETEAEQESHQKNGIMNDDNGILKGIFFSKKQYNERCNKKYIEIFIH